jgi:dTDP-4-dehydrorhamnose 3,5-epimerase
MIFIETGLKDAFVIEIERREDERGFFARSWCQGEFEAHGLNTRIAQCNISLNTKKGTLRGMHYQAEPCEEAKLVRCTRGSLYDVIVDLHPDSQSYKKHLGVVLTPDNGKMLYVPEGFAHGFLTLEDNTEVHYQISEFYAPDHARGFRWNDPAFAIVWPAEVKIISDRDRNYPDFRG